MKQPTTPAEWQEVVELAEAYLLLDSARCYGLVTGAPKISVERCEEFIAEGRRRGHVATDEGVGLAIRAIVAAYA